MRHFKFIDAKAHSKIDNPLPKFKEISWYIDNPNLLATLQTPYFTNLSNLSELLIYLDLYSRVRIIPLRKIQSHRAPAWKFSRISNDIDMKPGQVTKRDKWNTATSKRFAIDVMSANYDVIFIFPIYDQFGVIRKPSSGRMVCFSSLTTFYLTKNKNWTENFLT